MSLAIGTVVKVISIDSSLKGKVGVVVNINYGVHLPIEVKLYEDSGKFSKPIGFYEHELTDECPCTVNFNGINFVVEFMAGGCKTSFNISATDLEMLGVKALNLAKNKVVVKTEVKKQHKDFLKTMIDTPFKTDPYKISVDSRLFSFCTDNLYRWFYKGPVRIYPDSENKIQESEIKNYPDSEGKIKYSDIVKISDLKDKVEYKPRPLGIDDIVNLVKDKKNNKNPKNYVIKMISDKQYFIAVTEKDVVHGVVSCWVDKNEVVLSDTHSSY